MGISEMKYFILIITFSFFGCGTGLDCLFPPGRCINNLDMPYSEPIGIAICHQKEVR